jgi:hypothetical protein
MITSYNDGTQIPLLTGRILPSGIRRRVGLARKEVSDVDGITFQKAASFSHCCENLKDYTTNFFQVK